MARRAVALGLLLAACQPDPGPSGPPVPYSLGQRPSLPFPTGALLHPDASTPTGLRVQLGAEGTNLAGVDEALFYLGADFARALTRSDGWTTLAPAFWPMPEAAEPGSLAGHVLLVDLDAPAIVPTETRTFGGETSRGRPTHWVSIVAPLPLRPKTRHALVLLRGLKTAAGAELAPAPLFRKLLDGEDLDATDGDAEQIRRARERLEGVDRVLESDLGIARSDVLAADTFTTLSVVEEMQSLAAAYRAAPAPVLVPHVYRSPLEDARFAGPDGGDYRAISAFVRAELEVPLFRETAGEPLVFDPAKSPSRWEKIELVATVPVGSGPFPVLLYQHGFLDEKESFWRWANEVAEIGVAMVAFDFPLHGARSPRGGTALAFVDLADPARTVDNLRQAPAEHAYFVRAIDALAQLDLFGDGSRRLDSTRLFWLGNSLGSIAGVLALAIEPRYQGAVLGVGGSKLGELFSRALEGFSLADYPGGISVAAAQTGVDKADPSNFAPLVGDRQILLLQAMHDEIVPTAATQALGRALGLPQIEPVLAREPSVPVLASPAARRGWLQFDPADHALIWGPRGDGEAYRRSRAAMRAFLSSWAATGVAEVR